MVQILGGFSKVCVSKDTITKNLLAEAKKSAKKQYHSNFMPRQLNVQKIKVGKVVYWFVEFEYKNITGYGARICSVKNIKKLWRDCDPALIDLDGWQEEWTIKGELPYEI